MKKIYSLLFISFLFVILLMPSVLLAQAPTPELNVKLPFVEDFTPLEAIEENQEGDLLSVPWLAQYIIGLYRFTYITSGIIAVIVIMYAGFRWATSAGNSSQISQAKTMIQSAIAGIVFIFGGFTLLNFINPALVDVKGIQIKAPSDFGLNSSGELFTENLFKRLDKENQQLINATEALKNRKLESCDEDPTCIAQAESDFQNAKDLVEREELQKTFIQKACSATLSNLNPFTLANGGCSNVAQQSFDETARGDIKTAQDKRNAGLQTCGSSATESIRKNCEQGVKNEFNNTIAGIMK